MQKCGRYLLEHVGEDLICKAWRCGGHFGVHDDQGEENIIDIGFGVLGASADADRSVGG